MKKIIASILILNNFCIAQTLPSGPYTVNKNIRLEGNGTWDYITFDEPNERLFVSHATMVHVVDVKTGKQTGTINDTKGVHGIALAHALNKGYTSNGKDSSVTVFDLKTLKTLSKIKVTGAKPDAILFDKHSGKVFVFNGKSANATVIDPATDKVIATMALDGKPEFSVSDEKGKVFVNLEDKNAIAVINPTSFKVEKTITLKPGEEPTGLAIDLKSRRLFSVCGNKLLVVINAENGTVVTTLPIGEHCDGVTFDPGSKKIYASNGEGSVTVIKEENENAYKVIETIKTQPGAKTITVNTQNHHVYLPVAEFGETPPASKEEPKPKPAVIPNTFVILDLSENI
jgi:YVTN family beta-propeller protein